MSRGEGGGQKAGTYLGGIRTVEDLRCRCRIDEETGCWHWGLSLLDGCPSVHFVLEGVRMKSRGRRAALLLAGVKLPKGHTVFARTMCEAEDCVNPDHARSGSRKQEGDAHAKSGRLKGVPAKVAAARKLADRKRKLTPEAVHEIRTSGLSQVKLAKKFGVSQYAVWSAKVGRSHKPRTASIFDQAAWL